VKGFKFRLQSVLDAREKKFEDSQLEFVKAQHRLQQEKQIMSNLLQELEKTTIGLEKVLNSGGIDNTLIFIHQNYIVTLKREIKLQQQRIEEAEKFLEEKNHLMLEALKAKKVMEKLKEKALEEFKESLNRHDLILIDEIATGRYKKTN
jgi:flagellar FliJ protein